MYLFMKGRERVDNIVFICNTDIVLPLSRWISHCRYRYGDFNFNQDALW